MANSKKSKKEVNDTSNRWSVPVDMALAALAAAEAVPANVTLSVLEATMQFGSGFTSVAAVVVMVVEVVTPVIAEVSGMCFLTLLPLPAYRLIRID